MMKKAKKMVAAMMALVLTLAMNITVFAAPGNGTFSVTIKDAEKGHTYEAYQVFSGELSEDGTKLSNISWGEGISKEGQEALGDAAAYAQKLSEEGTSAEAEAAVIGEYLTTATASSSDAKEADGKYTYVINNLPAGYYLIKDADGSLAGTEGAYSSYILQVVKNVEVEPKADVASVSKFVKDTNDSTGDTTDWQKSADYDEGDAVPFRLVATMPSNIDDYAAYRLVFHDTLSAGLTYTDGDAFTVTIGDSVVEGFTKTVTQNDDGTTAVEFACDDIKALGSVTAGTTVAVEYTAVLNDKAVTGAAGNNNEVFLEFSNNPNKTGAGETGTTPKDQAVVFTYKVVINKVDQNNQPLAGAEFTLYKMVNGEKNAVTTATVSSEGTTFEFLRLDDGEYVLEETKTPDGYNSIPEVAFTIVADHANTALTLDALTANQTSEGTTMVRFAENLAEGALATDVMNAQGATLPSTGGAGTVAIYTIAIVLILGAALILITRKRVGKK